MKFFTSEETKSLITSERKIVYLYGSNMGYENFGDIIQLKNEIAYHKQVSGYEPVVFLRLSAPLGYATHESNKDWYDVSHIVYMDQHQDTHDDLIEIRQVKVSHPLHVYGGGFLNDFWGTEMLGEIVSILEGFQVKDYIFSGQQISQSMVNEIKMALQKNPPALFGVRDYDSLDYIQKEAAELNGMYSFDDVTETLLGWVGKKATVQQKIKKYASSSILWHFNTTGYVAESAGDLGKKIQKAQKRFPGKSCTVVQSYNDKSGDAKDSIQTIAAMGNHFPYTSYKVINLAQMALQMTPHTNQYPDLKGVLGGVDVAVASSYHTAMLMNYLGIPSYLMAANDYYQQKQKSLGFISDFDKFLDNPKQGLRDFSQELDKREIWLKAQSDFFSKL